MQLQTTLLLLFLSPLFLLSQIPNDSCEEAEPMPAWDGSNMTSAVLDQANATASGVNPPCESMPDDGWYSFVMPFDGNILISGSSNAEAALYNFDAGTCYGSNLYCGSLSGNHVFGLVNGETYVIQLWRTLGTTGDITFSILATPPIDNDDCSTAEALPAWDANDETSASFDTNGATPSDVIPSCYIISRDGWYSFTMPYDGNLLISGSANSRIVIYEQDMATCYGEEIYCGSLSTNHAYNLVGGEDYLVQAYRILGTDGELNFTLLTSPLLSNDECSTAIAFPAWDSNNETFVTYDTNSATPGTDILPSCEIAPPRDAWFSMTMPFEGQLYLTGTANSEITIYHANGGTCFETTEVYCGNLSTTHAFDLEAGQDYMVRAYRVLGTDGIMDINLEAVPKIAHDECATATELVFDLANTSNNGFNSDGASPSPEDNPSCEAQVIRDGWYVFESPINGYFDIVGSNFTEFAIYGTCGGVELACIQNDQDFAVVQGETYYIRAFRRLGTDGEMEVNLVPSVAKVATGTPGACESIPSITIDSDNNDEWVNIFDDAGDVVASLKANAQNLGEITCNLEIDAEDVRIYEGPSDVPYLRREVEISTEFAPTSEVDVRMYVLFDEAQDLLIADPDFSNIFTLEFNKKDVDGCSGGLVGGFERIFNDKAGFYDEDDYYFEFQVSSFSTFYPGNIFMVLPVELSHFIGTAKGQYNHLEWETASEVNSDKFIIERSPDGSSWAAIGEVAANINSLTAQHYSFQDNQAPSFAYYRLKIMDRDGSYEYSTVVSILNERVGQRVLVFPNPVKEELSIQLKEESDFMSLELYALSGKKVLAAQSIDGTTIIDLSDLEAGAYLLKVLSSQGVHTKIIQKYD